MCIDVINVYSNVYRCIYIKSVHKNVYKCTFIYINVYKCM